MWIFVLVEQSDPTSATKKAIFDIISYTFCCLGGVVLGPLPRGQINRYQFRGSKFEAFVKDFDSSSVNWQA